MSLIEAQQLLPKLASGMVPKVEAAINALNSGVDQVRIVDGREQNIVYRSIANDLGTVIYHG
jgi:acetylglutamate kinase